MSRRIVHQLLKGFIPYLLLDLVLPTVGEASFSFDVPIGLAVAYSVSTLIYWWCEYHFLDYSMPGPTLKDLRTWLATKYLWFSESTHGKLDEKIWTQGARIPRHATRARRHHRSHRLRSNPQCPCVAAACVREWQPSSRTSSAGS